MIDEIVFPPFPGWTWDPSADQWEERYNFVLDYVDHHGHARVPTSYTTEDGYQLGKWVAVQRNFYKDGTLRGATQLVNWVATQRASEVVQRQRRQPIGIWVTRQRRSYAGGTLDADRARRLEALPKWTWKAR